MKDEGANGFMALGNLRAVTGESPLWDARRALLWWIDIQGQMLISQDLEDGPARVIALPSTPGLVSLADDGNLVLGLESGLWHFAPETGKSEHMCRLPDPDHRLRINDGKPDATGRLWFGTMDRTGSGSEIGALLCREADGTVRTVRDRLRTPNAICVSRDGDRLYYADTAERELRVAPLDLASGTLGDERCLVRFEEGEYPDGMSVDSEGCLWLALVGAGSILRLDETGRVLLRIKTPVSRPTMPIFAGPQLDRLVITSQRRTLTFEALEREPTAGAPHVAAAGCRGALPYPARLGQAA